jgi:hypothetical protein
MLARSVGFLLALLIATPVVAADPIFPPGSRIGIVPPPGMTVSKAFPGFEDRSSQVAMLFMELSASAYPDIEKQFATDALKAQGVEVTAHQDLQLKSGHGFMVTARQPVGAPPGRKYALVATADDLTAIISVQVPDVAEVAYSDAAMHAALATFTTRAEVPVEEQLALLPFALKDLGGMRIVRAAANGAALLTYGPSNAIEIIDQPLLLITLAPGVQDPSSEGESLARRAISTIPDVKELRLLRSEKMRISGQNGHEIIADARDAQTNIEVTLAQWLRFGTSASVRVLGAARKDQWDQYYPRFRAVRDGIEAK